MISLSKQHRSQQDFNNILKRNAPRWLYQKQWCGWTQLKNQKQTLKNSLKSVTSNDGNQV